MARWAKIELRQRRQKDLIENLYNQCTEQLSVAPSSTLMLKHEELYHCIAELLPDDKRCLVDEFDNVVYLITSSDKYDVFKAGLRYGYEIAKFFKEI